MRGSTLRATPTTSAESGPSNLTMRTRRPSRRLNLSANALLSSSLTGTLSLLSTFWPFSDRSAQVQCPRCKKWKSTHQSSAKSEWKEILFMDHQRKCSSLRARKRIEGPLNEKSSPSICQMTTFSSMRTTMGRIWPNCASMRFKRWTTSTLSSIATVVRLPRDSSKRTKTLSSSLLTSASTSTSCQTSWSSLMSQNRWQTRSQQTTISTHRGSLAHSTTPLSNFPGTRLILKGRLSCNRTTGTC